MDQIMEYEETFDVRGASAAELERNAGRIMEELLCLEGGVDGVMDSAVSIDTDAMTITLEFAKVIPAKMTQDQALVALRSVARTAIHATGGYTPNWEPLSVHQEHELVDA